MIHRYLKNLPDRIIKICYIQLVVSIFSFLITVFWGISFSPLSLLGNIFFSPILIIFLGLSTLLFFTELLFIPNQYIAYALNFVSYWWIFLLKCGPGNTYNITSTPPSYLLTATIICITFIIILQNYRPITKCYLLLLIISISYCYMQEHARKPSITEIPCNKGALHIVAADDMLTVIDPGYLGRSIAAESFVEYTLIPSLAQLYGTSVIDHLVLLQPGTTTFKAAKKIIELCQVKNIYIPMWQQQDNNAIAGSFMRMKELAYTRNCCLHRLRASEYILSKKNNHAIELHALPTTISSSGIRYTAYEARGSIDNKTFTFYPAKYTQQS